ncbi:DnaJ domain-containing protein [Candidatus Nitrosopelagicus sp.]|nr:DnaJ domain-containing protein [Candidatus Nitrosopelagicus sp.]|tara:strand:- start:91 stop:924 length:834 start_codon:yes stop_codon:yes gene_type:complete
MKKVYFGIIFLMLFLPLSNAFGDELTLNIDKTLYEKSDFISVWGSTPFDSVFISVRDSDGKNVWNESLDPDDENKFSTLIIAGIGGWQKSGNYLVVAESGDYTSSAKFFYDSGAQVNPPSAVSDYYVSPEDLYLTFTIAVIIIAGIFIYLARHIILRKKTSYDEAKLDSKKDRDYEKYHSEWSEEEIFGSHKRSTEAKEFSEMYNDNSLPNYYLVLELTNDSSELEIKSQYRKLAKRYHPDRNKDSSEDKMAQINKAYEILSDKKLKAEYDKFCKLL